MVANYTGKLSLRFLNPVTLSAATTVTGKNWKRKSERTYCSTILPHSSAQHSAIQVNVNPILQTGNWRHEREFMPARLFGQSMTDTFFIHFQNPMLKVILWKNECETYIKHKWLKITCVHSCVYGTLAVFSYVEWNILIFSHLFHYAGIWECVKFTLIDRDPAKIGISQWLLKAI